MPKPPVGGPAQAADLGRAPSGGKPNWDDYMTPDEMDEFEQWQAEQDQIDGAEAAAAAQQGEDECLVHGCCCATQAVSC